MTIFTASDFISGPKDRLVEFVRKGLGYPPQWTTTRCAVKLQGLTGLALVCMDSKKYNDIWCYSLALAGEVDPGPVELSDRAAEASFELAKVWKTPLGAPGVVDVVANGG